jgi:hypothetical protein
MFCQRQIDTFLAQGKNKKYLSILKIKKRGLRLDEGKTYP